MARSHATQASAVMRRSVVIFALRHGAQASADPAREHAALDRFLAPFASLPFDDGYDRLCTEIRRTLERSGSIIGPHDPFCLRENRDRGDGRRFTAALPIIHKGPRPSLAGPIDCHLNRLRWV